MFGSNRNTFPNERRRRPHAPPPATPPRPVYLTVTLSVERKSFRRLERLAYGLLKPFSDAGLVIKASGWRAAGEKIEIFNLWRMNDSNTLINAELALVDDPNFLLLDLLLENEVKEMTVAITDVRLHPKGEWDRRTKKILPINGPHCYVKVANDIETSGLAEFRARYESTVDRFRRDYHWRLGDGFLGLTGGDGVTQIWAVPVSLLGGVTDTLARTPWDDLLESPPQFTILRPSPWDPIMPISYLQNFDEQL